MRLVHISDLHYSSSSRRFVASLLEQVADVKPDHLLITGDLTEHARAGEFKAVKELLRNYGFRDSGSLTVIPGNHDIFGFIYEMFAEGEISQDVGTPVGLARTIKKLWTLRSKILDFYDSDYIEAVEKFSSHFEFSMRNCITVEGSDSGFPFAKLLGSNLAVIGVDSNYYVPVLYNNLGAYAKALARFDLSYLGENLSGSTGWADKDALSALLEDPRVAKRRKIVLMHHYLYTKATVASHVSEFWAEQMRLYNRDSISKVIRENDADVVIHGHWHNTEQYKLTDGTPVLNGGGSLDGEFNMIEVKRGGLSFSTIGKFDDDDEECD